MAARTSPANPAPRRADGFVTAVLTAVSWRAILLTQSLGLLFAVVPWLVSLGRRPDDYLPFLMVQQAGSALFVMLAALAADEAVRRGWSVWRAFATGLLCALLASAALQGFVMAALGLTDPVLAGPMATLQRFVLTFFDAGVRWGTVLMVYLNRQSARRVLAVVRAGELGRLQAERRLLASRLAATETQVEPQAVRQWLERLRNLYAAQSGDADRELERFIGELRDAAARGLRAAEDPP